MRYLKKFESSVEFYTKIDDIRNIRPYDLRVFSEKESKEIEKIANYYTLEMVIEKKYQNGVNYSCICIVDKIPSAFGGCVFIYIYKTDDEWYYISSQQSIYTYHWFKCDQIEGVIKCLQDEILKKYK